MSSSPRPRVVGLGLVSSLGFGTEAVFSSLSAEISAAHPSPLSPRGIPVPASAGALEGTGLRLEDLIDARYSRRLAGISKLALAAAVQAFGGPSRREPSLAGDRALRDETAVILGTSFGASSYHFEYYEKLFRNGLRDASPLLFSESVMNSAAGHVALYLKLRGPGLAQVGGEEVGLAALVEAFDRITLGEVPCALAGGAEEYCDFVHAAVASGGLVGAEPGLAFGGGKGAFFSEGAAFLLVERGDGPGLPGLEPLATLAGGGLARGPSSEHGAAGAVERAALQALRGSSGPISLVLLSASGGPLDLAEAEGVSRALRALGQDPSGVLVAAPRSLLGEGFAYSTAALAALGVEALRRRSAPGTAALPGVSLPGGLRLAAPGQELGAGAVLVVALSRRGSAAACLLTP